MPNPFQGFGAGATYETLVGPVVTSDFTTTSASSVDVTGMTVTLASGNNPSVIKVFAVVQMSAGTALFDLNTTATIEYTWILTKTAPASTIPDIVRNGDLTSTSGTSCLLELNGYLTGVTSGVVVKVRTAAVGGITVTFKVGSVIQATF